MKNILAATPRQAQIGLAILRLAVATIFIAHGAQKFFVFGLDGAAGAFGGMGIPMPQLTAALVATVEFFGGIALAAGLLTRLVALPLAINMLGAMVLVHLKNGFFLPTGIEFVLVLFAASAAFVVAGPGAFALDNLFNRRFVASVRPVTAAARRQQKSPESLAA